MLTTQKIIIKDEEYGLTEYNDAKISVAAEVVITLVAPLMTTIPMFILYFVLDVKNRLGIIMGFTTLFSIWLVSTLSLTKSKLMLQIALQCFPTRKEPKFLLRLVLSLRYRSCTLGKTTNQNREENPVGISQCIIHDRILVHFLLPKVRPLERSCSGMVWGYTWKCWWHLWLEDVD